MAEYCTANASYELPKMDLKLWDKVEAVDKAATGRPKFSAMLEFVKECLPTEAIEEEIGGTTIDTVDLNKLNICAMGIQAAYNREVSSAQIAANMETLEKMRDLADTVNSISAASKAVKAAGNRQKFAAVAR